MRATLRLVTLVCLLAAPGAALAQPAVTSASDTSSADPARAPGFVTLDRGDARSIVGLDISYMFYGNTAGASITPMFFDAHAQYVDPGLGLGGYVELPVGYFDASGDGPSTSGTGLGDLEVGALYVTPTVAPGLRIVLRAGLTLPTASTSESGVEANTLTFLPHLSDFYLVVPDGLSARFAASALWRQGTLFARADIGVDTNISAQSGDNVDTLLRGNLGFGVQLGQLALTAEFTSLYDHGDNGGNAQLLSTGAVAARYSGGRVSVYGAIGFPITNTHDLGGSDSAQYDVALTLGIEGRLR
jgi:hypothetical protein